MRSGFTLVELLAVIIIMGLILGLSIPLFDIFGPGATLREAGNAVQGALMQARQLAANSMTTNYFIVFQNFASGAVIYTYQDVNNSNAYASNDTLVGSPIYLPSGVVFYSQGVANYYSAWIGVSSTGYLYFPSGYVVNSASAFDAFVAYQTPPDITKSDITLAVQNHPYRFFMSIDSQMGRIRRTRFYSGM